MNLSEISFVSLDPGVRYYGGSLFECGELTWADLESREEIPSLALEAGYAVIERPRKANDKRATRGDIQDLELAAGEYGGHFKQRKYVTASSVPKDIRHARAIAALTEREKLALPKQKTKLKHVLCAVYIGLKELGRV